MAGVKETPRQKMIAMMYLVYTAMLALNVSVEILDAFKVVNATTVETNSNFEKKLNDTYASFEAQMATDSAGTVEFFNKAREAKKLSDDLVEYLIDVRGRLIVAACGQDKAFMDPVTKQVDPEKLRNVSLDTLKKIDDMSICVDFFVPATGKGGEAAVMIEKFKQFKDEIKTLLKPEDAEKIKWGLDTDKKYYSKLKKIELPWADYYFGSSVLAADVVILNGFIQEVRNMEFDVLSKLRSYVGATDFKFNTVEARVIPKKTTIFKGEEYEAEILVIAYDSTESPTVLYRTGAKEWNDGMAAGANEIQIKEKGKSVLRLGTGGFSYGSQSYAGVIKIQTPDGEIKDYPFSSEFFVQPSSANISADKLNVLYRGLKNPISVAVPGIAAELVSCRIKSGNADISKVAAGVYNVEPKGAADIELEAIVTENGKSRSLTSKVFRVKPLPTPQASIAGVTEGAVSKNKILQAGKIEVKMGDDFLFEGITYTVKEYEVMYQKGGGYIEYEKVSGGALPQKVKDIINGLSRNAPLVIQGIKAVGPGGVEYKAAPLSVKVY